MRRPILTKDEALSRAHLDRTGAFNAQCPRGRPPPSSSTCAGDGDAALRALTEKFDGVAIDELPRARARPSTPRWRQVDPDMPSELRQARCGPDPRLPRAPEAAELVFRPRGRGHRGLEGDAFGIRGHLRARRTRAVPLNGAHERPAGPGGRRGVASSACTPPTKDGTLDAAIARRVQDRRRHRDLHRRRRPGRGGAGLRHRDHPRRWPRSPARATPSWPRPRSSSRATWAST